MDTAWLDKEIAALRLNFLRDENLAPPTAGQLQALGSLIGQGLSDHRRIVRIEILREITGIDRVSSSKELTLGAMNVLITYLKVEEKEDWDLNDNGKRFLEEIEGRCVERLPAKKARKRRVEKRDTETKEAEESKEEEIVWIGGDAPGFGDEAETQGESELETGETSQAKASTRGNEDSTQEQVDDRQRESHDDRVERVLRNMRAAGYQPRYARSTFNPW